MGIHEHSSRITDASIRVRLLAGNLPPFVEIVIEASSGSRKMATKVGFEINPLSP